MPGQTLQHENCKTTIIATCGVPINYCLKGSLNFLLVSLHGKNYRSLQKPEILGRPEDEVSCSALHVFPPLLWLPNDKSWKSSSIQYSPIVSFQKCENCHPKWRGNLPPWVRCNSCLLPGCPHSQSADLCSFSCFFQQMVITCDNAKCRNMVYRKWDSCSLGLVVISRSCSRSHTLRLRIVTWLVDGTI